MIGERGGSTATLEAGVALIEEHRASLAQSIRDDILSWLTQYGEWHRNNLRVEVPADSKNAVGAVVIGLINSGVIEETGERRKSDDPASHGRKSNCYRFRRSDGVPGKSASRVAAVPSKNPRAASFPRAAQAGKDEPGAALPQQETDPVGGADNSLAPSTDRLFDIQTSHYDQEAA